MHYDKDFGIECRIARFHNIYGPYGTWKGGREKAPAAFCRKVVTTPRAERHMPLPPTPYHLLFKIRRRRSLQGLCAAD